MGSEFTKIKHNGYKLPNGWKIVKVKDVATINEKSITRDYPYKFIEYIDISSVEKGRILNTQIIPLQNAPTRARRILRDNDILISTVRPNLEHYAFIKKANKNAVASTGFAVVTAKRVEPRYLYYYLTTKAFTEYLTRIAETHTSAYPAINPDVIETADLLLPPDDEQQAIAHILGTLDDKIELNHRMNETLEAMAQAIFKSWFVDFAPVVVNAIKAGNPIPEKFTARAAHYRKNPDALGLPDHILRLFPDRFVDSKLGPIPEGWEVGPIGELVKCVGGATPSTKNKKFWEGGTNPFLTPKDMASLDAPVVLDTERHITDLGVQQISSKKLPVGTVLLSSRAPIGYLAINEVPISINQGIIAMICNSILPNYYVFFWVKNNIEIIKGKAGGTTFAEISKKNFRPIPVLKPDTNILKMFVFLVEPLYKQIVENVISSKMLTSIRDALLPKLISGELRVKDVERIVGCGL